MKFLLALLIFVGACSPVSKSGLIQEDPESSDRDEASVEALEFSKLCNDVKAAGSIKTTVKLIVEKTKSGDCLEAAEKVIEAEELDLSQEAVLDVKPILFFKGLKALYLSATGVSYEDIGELSRLEKLEILDVSENALRAVPPLSPSLKKLDVSGNEIEKLSVTTKLLMSLEELSIRDNNVAELEGIPTNLKALDVGENPVEGSFKNFGTLRDLKMLKDLYLTNEKLFSNFKKHHPKLNLFFDRALEIE